MIYYNNNYLRRYESTKVYSYATSVILPDHYNNVLYKSIINHIQSITSINTYKVLPIVLNARTLLSTLSILPKTKVVRTPTNIEFIFCILLAWMYVYM